MRVKYAEVVMGPSSLGISLKLEYLWCAFLGCQKAFLILRRNSLCATCGYPGRMLFGYSNRPVRDGRDFEDECLCRVRDPFLDQTCVTHTVMLGPPKADRS